MTLSPWIFWLMLAGDALGIVFLLVMAWTYINERKGGRLI